MAVLVEAISVIVQLKSIHELYSGGRKQFRKEIPNRTYCADNHLVRVGFMHPRDVKCYTNLLKQNGLSHLDSKGEPVDFVIADQLQGLFCHCSWIEFGRINLDYPPDARVSACWKTGSREELVTPDGWIYEESLSCKYTFVQNEDLPKQMGFLQPEQGMDVYLNLSTGREEYVGRTSPPQRKLPSSPADHTHRNMNNVNGIQVFWITEGVMHKRVFSTQNKEHDADSLVVELRKNPNVLKTSIIKSTVYWDQDVGWA